MSLKKIAITATCALSIIACSPDLECSSSDAKDLVKSITDKKMIATVGKEKSKNFTYGIQSIITEKKDDELNFRKCSATMTVYNKEKDKTTSFPISYDLRVTDDGNELIAEVFGL